MSKTKRQIIDESVSDTDASWVEVAMQAWADQKLEEYKERLKARFKDWFEEEDDITVATIFKTIDEL